MLGSNNSHQKKSARRNIMHVMSVKRTRHCAKTNVFSLSQNSHPYRYCTSPTFPLSPETSKPQNRRAYIPRPLSNWLAATTITAYPHLSSRPQKMSEKPTPSKADEWVGPKANKFDKYATTESQTLPRICTWRLLDTDFLGVQQGV